ncbi:hypothetical protein D3C75_633470 [compost metagenome]
MSAIPAAAFRWISCCICGDTVAVAVGAFTVGVTVATGALAAVVAVAVGCGVVCTAVVGTLVTGVAASDCPAASLDLTAAWICSSLVDIECSFLNTNVYKKGVS